MKLSQKGFDLIIHFEGYHTALPDGGCKAYLDTLAKPNVWTIGWGCTRGVTKGLVWTRAQAEDALRREIAVHEDRVNKLVKVAIGQGNFDALVSFDYNCGALGKSTLLKKLNAGDYDGAAREFDRWVYAGGVKYKGLVRRRAAERAMFEADARDDIPDDEPDMPQAVEPAMQPPSRSVVAGIAATGGITIASVGETVQVAKEAKDLVPPTDSYAWPALIMAAGLITAVLIVKRWSS